MSREIDIRREGPLAVTPPSPPVTIRPPAASGAAPGGRAEDHAPAVVPEAAAVPLPASKEARDATLVREALQLASSISPTQGLGDESSFAPDPTVASTSSGASSVNLQHQYQDIPVFQSSLLVRFNPDGKLREAASSLTPEPDQILTDRSVSASQAVKIAVQYVATPQPDEFNVPDQFGETSEPPRVDVQGFEPSVLRASAADDPTEATTFQRGPFAEDITASLTWFPVGSNMGLAWSMMLEFPEHIAAYHVLVDANAGKVVYCRNETQSVAAAGWIYRLNGGADRELVAFPVPWENHVVVSAAVGQPGWARCTKCGSLVLSALQGICPAGGMHDAAPGENYSAMRNSSTYPGEDGWRCCARCGALYQASASGVCADGQPHTDKGDGNYRVLRDAPLSIGSSGWRQCSRCATLVGPSGAGLRCAAGGQGAAGAHDVTASPTYTLPLPRSLPPAPRDWVDSDHPSGNCTVVDLVGSTDVPVGASNSGVVTFSPADPFGAEQLQLNLFYYCCYMHDVTYLLGFQEGDGNFQVTDFDLGGTGGDPVLAHAYSGAVPSTASMTTNPEGQSPIMKMGLVTKSKRHTAFDATVVFHEYFHGVSNRLVGGPANTTALAAPQSAGMGEGWSDFVACTLCDVDVVAAWVMNTRLGIRRYPYDDQFPDGFGALGKGRYLYEPHNIGEIWAAALMEMARRTDPDLALQLVVDALKLTKALPSFLDARDAILVALDNLLQAGRLSQAQHDGAWLGIRQAFAKFGMGPNAKSSGAELDSVVADTSIGEDGWSRCSVCAGLFRPDGPSACRDGKPHTADTTAPPYEVVVNRPDYPGEAGWHACSTCGQLYLPGAEGGACWSGGKHTPADRGEYSVIVNAVGPAGETEWRRCDRCQTLYFSHITSAACPAGGVHEAAPADYRLIARK